MGKHDHASCLHSDIHYCRHCNVVYCNGCDVTWHQYSWTCSTGLVNRGWTQTSPLTYQHNTQVTTTGSPQLHSQLHGQTSG